MPTDYELAFDDRFRLPLRLIGVTPARSGVRVTGDRLTARFGPWLLRTPLDNIRSVAVTGPHRPVKAIGPRLSFATRGLTFGSNAERTVRIEFREPVPGIDPVGVLRHPSLSVSVADPEGLARRLRARAGAT